MELLHKLFKPKPVEQWNDPHEMVEHRKQRKRLSETNYMRAQALAAWLLATLVAVNGGALATDFTKVGDAPPFVMGVVLAILSGFSSWQEAQDRSGMHYIESLAAENITQYGQKLECKLQWRAPALRFAAKALNWSALAAFVIGCWRIGVR